MASRSRAFHKLVYSDIGEELREQNERWQKRIPMICGGSCCKRMTVGRGVCVNWPDDSESVFPGPGRFPARGDEPGRWSGSSSATVFPVA